MVHWRREWQITSVFLPWEPQKQYEKGMATHSSILAWRIPRMKEPGGLQSMGLQNWTDWTINMHVCVRTHTPTHTHTHTRLTELVFLKMECRNLPFKTGNCNNSETHLGLRTMAFWWNWASTAVKHRFNSKCSFSIPANNQLQYYILTARSVDFNLCDNIILYGLI